MLLTPALMAMNSSTEVRLLHVSKILSGQMKRLNVSQENAPTVHLKWIMLCIKGVSIIMKLSLITAILDMNMNLEICFEHALLSIKFSNGMVLLPNAKVSLD